jgi:hypothetical protein
MYFYSSNSAYYLTSTQTAGVLPMSSTSGEIIVELDWSQLSGGSTYNTYQVAAAVLPAMLSTNFIPELGGHSLVEFPMHLIGHSRGGSLICELSRSLGTNGIWVDHLTTLDPHPLNDPAFPLDGILYSAVDAPAKTYVNVLFHDNYWENISAPVSGEAVSGAYVRKLTNLNGGYSSAHSDVHLWYHGTIDWRTPASDTEASITSSERTNWWATAESNGVIAGFTYTLIGGANRTGTNRPLGASFPPIRDGYNQWWDLGAGTSSNRTTISTNTGAWPNLMSFNRMTTNQVVSGQTMPMRCYYQWAHSNTSTATVSIYLDSDFNPLNGNQVLLRQITVPGTGASSVGLLTTNITISTGIAIPGRYSVLASISGGGRTRFLYAPEPVDILAPAQPPALDISRLTQGQFVIGINGSPGQTVNLQQSTNFQVWNSVATNTLGASRWLYTNSTPNFLGSFYRAVLQ